MYVSRFTVSNDPAIYEAWPDCVLAANGDLVAVFAECAHHGDRSYTRIVSTRSTDRGRTWSAKTPVTPATGNESDTYYYNCPRISRLRDGRLALLVDRLPLSRDLRERTTEARNELRFSSDNGLTWSEPVPVPLAGIVPDKLVELDTGRWLVSAHRKDDGFLAQFLVYSGDAGRTWSAPVTVAKQSGLNLCEVTLVPLGGGVVVALHRENSGMGWDAKKTISLDHGGTWGPVVDFPLPGCHRPVAGFLADGTVMVTFRFMQGGTGWLGAWTQNFMGAFTDRESLLAPTRKEAWCRIFPIDYDRSSVSDLGYSGWVQFPDGEIYVVNYIVDDAAPKAQIRGYAFRKEDWLCDESKPRIHG